jgi:hypothetical protein
MEHNSEDLQDLYDEFYQLLDQAILVFFLHFAGRSSEICSLERPRLSKQLKDLVSNAEDFKERMYPNPSINPQQKEEHVFVFIKEMPGE